MQGLCYIRVNDEIIKLLVRQKKYTECLKIRKSGERGTRRQGYELFFETQQEVLDKLKRGEVVEL